MHLLAFESTSTKSFPDSVCLVFYMYLYSHAAIALQHHRGWNCGGEHSIITLAGTHRHGMFQLHKSNWVNEIHVSFSSTPTQDRLKILREINTKELYHKVDKRMKWPCSRGHTTECQTPASCRWKQQAGWAQVQGWPADDKGPVLACWPVALSLPLRHAGTRPRCADSQVEGWG